MTSFGKSGSKQESGSSQNVWGVQTPFLNNLYQGANRMFNSQAIDPMANAMGEYGEVSPYADTAIINQLSGGGGDPGSNWLNQRLDSNPFLTDSIRAAQDDIYRGVEYYDLPQLGDNAAGANAYGSDRHGIASALRLSEADRAAGNISATMRMDDLNQRQNAATMMSSMTQQAKQFGLGYVPQHVNNAVQPYNAGWMPYQNYASVLGGPHNVGDSYSKGSSKSMNIGFGKMG